MTDLDDKKKIDVLLDFAYDKTIERMNAIEEAHRNSIYQSIVVQKGNLQSYVFAYMNYYCGCLEGIFFTRFLEEFYRMPTPSENAFIADTITTRFKKLKETVLNLANKKFNEDS